MTTGETIALTIQTFVSKVMFFLFNMLSRFVIDDKFVINYKLLFDYCFFLFPNVYVIYLKVDAKYCRSYSFLISGKSAKIHN